MRPGRCVAAPARGLGLVFAALLGLGGGCRDRGEQAAVPPHVTAAAGLDAGPPPTVTPAAPSPMVRFDDGGDEDRALERLGALPAWRGALERYRLLARRGQEGALVGRLADDGAGGWRLVDEDGDGSLWLSLVLPDRVAVRAGQRVVAWGAFEVVAAAAPTEPSARAQPQAWRWRCRRIEALAPAAEPATVPLVPSHVPPAATAAPDGALTPSALAQAIDDGSLRRARRAEMVAYVVSSPTVYGDGWAVSDSRGGPVTALLVLPGETAIYGGQDYLADDERWQLERRAGYAVTVSLPRRLRRSDGVPVLSTDAAPRRLR